MNSLIFTKTPLKKKKPIIHGTNNMGKYYNNEKVVIKNFTSTSVAERIDKNMTNLQAPTNLTDKNLVKFINPILNNENFNTAFEENKLDVQMNLETNKKYFNTFATALNIHEIANDFDTNLAQEQEIFKNINNKKSLIDEILQNLRLSSLTIENVYQEKYGDVNASGIGDFLRGSYFLMQFSEQFNFSYNINMLNHPISQFLEIYQDKDSLIYPHVSVFRTTNFKPLLLEDSILSNIYNYKINICLLYFLYFHIFKIHAKSVIINNKKDDPQLSDKKIYAYIISYPITPIKEKHKQNMQQLLKPTTHFLSIINNTLDELGLVQKEFVVIHIRYGDKFLLKNEENTDLDHIKIIDKSIQLLDPNQQVLLISDNSIIKDIIIQKYPFIKTHFNEITHTGEGVEIDNDKLQNTMLDFYLFSFAEKIFAFSVYCHGTGFSKWAAETYSVPYVCRFLP